MKKQKPSEDYPLLKDTNHIYNQLIENDFKGVDLGWTFMEFHLAANLRHDDVDCDGVTLFNKNEIHFEMGLDDKTARITVIHEIIHCALETVGMDDRNYPDGIITTHNELIAVNIANQLAVINSLNPGLLELIYASNKG